MGTPQYGQAQASAKKNKGNARRRMMSGDVCALLGAPRRRFHV